MDCVTTHMPCTLQCMVQKKFGVFINILDADFSYLHNSSILHYYGESCGFRVDNNITFNHCIFNHNYGNSLLQLNLFHIVINNDGYIFSSVRDNCNRQLNVIMHKNCHFVNNSYTNSIIYFHLHGSLSINANVYISNSSFLYNYDAGKK